MSLTLALFAGCKKKDEQPETGGSETQSQDDTSKDDTASSDKIYNIYLITMDQMDQHWVKVHEGAEKAEKELGNVKLSWAAPDKKDDGKQIEMVNNAIADKADAILVAANGPDAITSILKKADEAGIKIIYVDSPANFDKAIKTLATDNKEAGVMAGKELLKALEAKGVTEGKVGLVGVNSATDSTVQREAGFREAFEGTKFTMENVQYTDGDASKAKDAASNFITDGCVALFGSNEGTTVGVSNAIAESKGKVLGVGFDTSDMVFEQIEKGNLVATMAQNPDTMGYEGVKTAVNALEGKETGEEYEDTGVTIVNAENLSDFKK